MTLGSFKTRVRHDRGKLVSSDEHLKTIYNNGCEQLIDFTIHRKALGVEAIADIAKSLDYDKQKEFCLWYVSTNPNKNDIDLYLSDKLLVTKSLFRG